LFLNMKLTLLTYAFAVFLAVRLMRNRMLSPASNPQFDGSLSASAKAVCQPVCCPVETVIGVPQDSNPDPLSRYIWYETLLSSLSVRPKIEVESSTKLLKLSGSL